MQQNAAGVYSLLPMATRVLEKVHRVIDEELQAVGAQKVSLPVMGPAALWKKSGRWQTTGTELMRVKDRKGNEFCLSPTHEEVITDLASSLVTSRRQLPLLAYQTGVKFRDEARPRHGLMRCREFWMKDLYSFDEGEEAAKATYGRMMGAYRSIFRRFGLPVAEAEADSGAIGDGYSQELHVLSTIGDDLLLTCGSCGYTANKEKAQYEAGSELQGAAKVPATSETAAFYVMACKEDSALSVFFYKCRAREGGAGGEAPGIQVAAAIVPAGREANDTQVERTLRGLVDTSVFVRLSEAAEEADVKAVVIDDSLLLQSTEVPMWAEKGAVSEARDGDRCPGDGCEASLTERRGMELGHAFYLGTKYSETFDASVGAGDEKVALSMGCYGLGTTRIIAAAVEHYHDAKGLMWWPGMAPYMACVVCKPKHSMSDISALETAIEGGLEGRWKGEVVLDDRSELSLGKKLAEAEQLGYPLVLVVEVGEDGKPSGSLEVRQRLPFPLSDLPDSVSLDDVGSVLSQIMDGAEQYSATLSAE